MQVASSGPHVIAHRGASAAAFEHTHHAYRLAVAQGAHILEIDVRSTADGELVLVHDASLLRTSGDPRRVDTLTRAGLELLDPAVRPLTLADALERYGREIRLLIELKEPKPHWEGLVVEAVQAHGLEDRVTLQSFDLRMLRRLRLRAPNVALASLHARRPSARILDAVARCATAAGVRHDHVDAGLVAAARSRGLAMNAWTANRAEEIERLLAAGVTGVITDVPDVAARAVAGLAVLEAA